MSISVFSISPTTVNSIIGMLGTIASALIGKEILSRKKLKDELLAAQSDIAFLLCVEALHCARGKANRLQSFKLRIRAQAKESGHTWSGRFTPGVVISRAAGGRPRLSFFERCKAFLGLAQSAAPQGPTSAAQQLAT